MPPAELDLPAAVDADLRTDVDLRHGRQQGNDVKKVHYAVTASDRSVELLGEVAHSDPGPGERDQPPQSRTTSGGSVLMLVEPDVR
jgi:hypothetical protein